MSEFVGYICRQIRPPTGLVFHAIRKLDPMAPKVPSKACILCTRMELMWKGKV